MILFKLKKQDWFLILAIVAILSAISIFGNRLFGAATDIAVQIAGVGSIILVLLELNRRRRIAEQEALLQTKRLINNNSRRLEDLMSIYAFIEPRVPFSFTRVTNFELETDFIRKMVELIVSKKPALMLETGSGISTVVTGYCLEKIGRGRLISLEHDKDHYERTKQMLLLHGLGNRVELILTPLVDQKVGSEMLPWYDISDLKIDEPIDIFIVDGPPGKLGPMSRYPALPLFYDKFAKDAVLMMDNGNRKGERMTAERWKNEYHDMEVTYFEYVFGAFMLTRKQDSPGKCE